jgi:uncharacterized membrane protein (DUF2068 family)
METAPGALRPRRRRPQVDWELIACGLRGHTLLGTDARELRADDASLAREMSGARWYRCLRCDSWIALEPPIAPTAAHPPSREEIELPLRGKALHDRIGLRVIAVERSLHFLILGLLGVAVLLFAARRDIRSSFYRVVTALQNAVGGGPVQQNGHGLFHDLDRLFTLDTGTLRTVGIVLLAYAVLEGVEAVGLWFERRWAEYLTFLATSILLIPEIYELVLRLSILKVLGFLINLAVVVYLLLAKRLFGLRGGGTVDARERAAAMSWTAIERATPP